MEHIETKQILVKSKISTKSTLDELFSECYSLSVKHKCLVTLHHKDEEYAINYLAVSGLIKEHSNIKNNYP